MITPEKDIVESLDVYADTNYLAQKLYDIAHDFDGIGIESSHRYFLMEARDNLLGLYGLLYSIVIAQKTKSNDPRKTPMRDSGLSTRTINILVGEGFNFVEDAQSVPEIELLKLPGFGRLALQEFRRLGPPKNTTTKEV